MIKINQEQIEKPSFKLYKSNTFKLENSMILSNAIFGAGVSIGLGLLAMAQAIESFGKTTISELKVDNPDCKFPLE